MFRVFLQVCLALFLGLRIVTIYPIGALIRLTIDRCMLRVVDGAQPIKILRHRIVDINKRVWVVTSACQTLDIGSQERLDEEPPDPCVDWVEQRARETSGAPLNEDGHVREHPVALERQYLEHSESSHPWEDGMDEHQSPPPIRHLEGHFVPREQTR